MSVCHRSVTHSAADITEAETQGGGREIRETFHSILCNLTSRNEGAVQITDKKDQTIREVAGK